MHKRAIEIKERLLGTEVQLTFFFCQGNIVHFLLAFDGISCVSHTCNITSLECKSGVIGFSRAQFIRYFRVLSLLRLPMINVIKAYSHIKDNVSHQDI